MKIKPPFYLILFCVCSCACQEKNDDPDQENIKELRRLRVQSDNSRDALDWAGVYSESKACEDCKGEKTEILLKWDLSYHKKVLSPGEEAPAKESSGTFCWNDNGSFITLSEAGTPSFKVGENTLIPIDHNGVPTKDKPLYKRVMRATIKEKYWKLVNLNGKEVPLEQNHKDIYFILKEKDSTVIGFGGCNSFSCKYRLDEETYRLTFSQMRSGLRACDRMEIEDQLFKVLSEADNYTVRADTLQLNKARMAPLARFEAVYLK